MAVQFHIESRDARFTILAYGRNSLGRLTRSDIERKLLTGMPVSWTEGTNKKTSQILLANSQARNLFSFLLSSPIRVASGLSDPFLKGLAAAYSCNEDPASCAIQNAPSGSTSAGWKLQAIEAEGFGGLNTWNGPVFRFEFNTDSLLLQGPNGSGKSSLVGAIVWALTGERPRDQADGKADDIKPVFELLDKPAIGHWPPIACYPPTTADLSKPPRVRVRLEFIDTDGTTATLERMLENGVLAFHVDPQLDVPSVFIETGILMPFRLGALRLSGGTSKLTDAIQKLTGLDDLIAIGQLVEGLCHKSREYLSYEKKELASAKKSFEAGVASARDYLAQVEVAMPIFSPKQTSDTDSEMGKFGKQLANTATELANVIANDLVSGLALNTAATQNQVISAISSAREDVQAGLALLDSWIRLESLDHDLDEAHVLAIQDAIAKAKTSADEAGELLKRSVNDSKFQLKAVAARWHAEHCPGPIYACPLCEHELNASETLLAELEELRASGSAAAKTFDDNLNSIFASLDLSVPSSLRHLDAELLKWEPRKAVIDDLRTAFVSKDRYAKCLSRFARIVERELQHFPKTELPSDQEMPDGVLKSVHTRIAVLERAIKLAAWYRSVRVEWQAWWENVKLPVASAKAAAVGATTEPISINEGLSGHLQRLSDAIEKAKPYQTAADSMRSAWTAGKSVVRIETELSLREAIADLIAPLKQLVGLGQAIAKQAVDELSAKISQILSQIYLTESLQYHDAQLSKKEGVTVYGDLGNSMRIDATLIANTSWVRAVLWAFIFSLREEAVEQYGKDLFPVVVLDDPQATFDAQHRHRWAQYIASLQNGSSHVQLMLTTYDEMFLELIKVDGVKGREALIACTGPELGHIGIFEGASLARLWQRVQKEKTPNVARDYMIAVRIYLEGLLRLMLRGEDPNVRTFVIGDSRDKLRHLHQTGIAPWNRSEFKKLFDALGKGVPEIKYIETAHHATGQHLGMAEATDVEKYWTKTLHSALDRCFRICREYVQLHGGLKALYAPEPLVVLPEGYNEKVAEIPLRVIGKAAALSDGRAADGLLEMDEYVSNACKKVTLGKHAAYQLVAATLEPVARPGDMLIVKEIGEPSIKSLVIAISGDRILARRFEVADNHSDVAVLTAQAINPRKIAPPVIAQRSTLEQHKIIGVLYESDNWPAATKSDMEVSSCAGEAIFTTLLSTTLGLVEVVGQSAEPLALHGQYIIVGNQISAAAEAIKKLDGRPVIAIDSQDSRYFKRLRVSDDRIVLESMDAGGDYAPIVLAKPGEAGNSLVQIWPVAGVLFELPN